jgi:hypothetical protein
VIVRATVMAVLPLLAGCGRLGFDAADDALCVSRRVSLPTRIEPGAPVEIALCPGISWLSIAAVAEGSRVTSLLSTQAPIASVGIELLDLDQFRYARSVWGPAEVSATGTVTIAAAQLVRIESDLRTDAMIEITVAPPPGRVFHLAADGNDAADGSVAAPWQTWPLALRQLIPGDTLIAHDGAWTDQASCAGLETPCLSSTSLPVANCSATERDGTPSLPITIIAQHQRHAHVAGGVNSAITVLDCASWIVDGLYGSGVDTAPGAGPGGVFMFDDTPGLIARNLLAVHPNRCGNFPAIAVGGTSTGSTDAVIEDSEAYDFHRGGLFAADSQNVTLRRNFVHSRDGTDQPCYSTVPADRGDVGMNCYFFVTAPSCRIESSIAENVYDAFIGAEAVTFSLHGSIALDAGYGVLHQSNQMPIVIQPTPRAVEDFVCLNCDVGIWNRGLRTSATGVTLVGGRARFAPSYGAGILADAGTGPGGVSTWRNILASDNERVGFEIAGQSSWSVSYSTVAGSPVAYTPAEPLDDDAGNIRRSLTTAPTQIGDTDGSCLVYVPRTSNMAGAGENGADIGANVVYRSVDAVTTDRKLWDQRTGQFPCGAIVPGVNDVPGRSCFDVHERLRVGVAGCAIP